jgi:hypothetical protein
MIIFCQRPLDTANVSRPLFRLFLLLCLVLAPREVHPGTCTPVSASITYEADDYFDFYINGNMVVNGTVFDAGAPPVTVSIPLTDFAAPGSPNYFAAEVVNSVANLIGAGWVITITCADGSMSYITDTDNTFTMYDDVNGSAPPPAAWVNPTWVDSGNLFNQAPIQAPPLGWFSPPLTHPITGAPLPILSHSASGTQSSLTEKLYFRESVILPEITPTVTPTPYPTVCGATPAFVQSSVVAGGCAGNGNPTSFTYTIPANGGQILLAQVESTVPVLSGVSWNGAALSQLPGSPVAIPSGNIYTYYMINPPPGTFTLAYNITSGCSWNAVATVYKNIDTASPFGTIKSNGGNASTFSDSVGTSSPYSIVHDFLAYPNGPFTFTGLTGTQLFASSASGCCYDVYGSYDNASAPTSYNLNYTQSTGAQNWWAETIELKAVTSCGTLTYTPTLSATPTPTATATGTRTPTSTATPSRTVTATDTLTVLDTSTDSATPSRTGTATPTGTLSATQTPTSTPSRTATASNTLTVSSTRTGSATLSSTQTGTPTQTATNSSTPTATATPSRSATPTETITTVGTRTDSPSQTPTPTSSASPSATPTQTGTALSTRTDTLSATSTATPSSSATPTLTITALSTRTDTLSATSTATPSSSATPTQTITVLGSRTNTASATMTSTVMPTQTASPSSTATSSSTAVDSATDSPTVTLSSTGTPSATVTPSPSASASATVSRTLTGVDTGTASGTPSPTGTCSRSSTPSPTFSATATQSLASTSTDTPTDSPSATASNSATRTPSPSSTLTVSPSLTPPRTPSATFTETKAPPPSPFKVTVTLFNSAGEKVKVVYDGPALAVANEITVSPLHNSEGGPIDIAIGGVSVANGAGLTWDGGNDNGQWVSDGVYYLQVSSIDAFGDVLTSNQAVSVVGAPPTAALQVYNSAGEMVRNIPLPSSSSLPTDFSVASSTFVVGTGTPSQGPSGLQIDLKLRGSAGASLPLVWDGLSDRGLPVSSGTYLLKLTYALSGQAQVVKTVSVTLLQNPSSPAKNAVASAVIAPNPVKMGSGQPLQVSYKVPAYGVAYARAYDMAGELVAEGADSAKSGKLALTARLNGGVYLIDFEIRVGSAVLAQRTLKAAIIR